MLARPLFQVGGPIQRSDLPNITRRGLAKSGQSGPRWALMRVPDVKEARWLISRLGTRSGVIDISQSHSSRGMAKLTMRKACGFRTFHVIEVALYHALGPPRANRRRQILLTNHKKMPSQVADAIRPTLRSLAT